jgi:hypothetical protein
MRTPADPRCSVAGCTEGRYVSPSGHVKGRCAGHLAQQWRERVLAHNADALEPCAIAGCPEPRQFPRSLCHGHWLARRHELPSYAAADPERLRAYHQSAACKASQRRWRQRNQAEQLAKRRALYPELRAKRRALCAATKAAGLSCQVSG